MFYLRLYLWVAPYAVVAVCLVGLLRRGLHRQLPMFASYIAFEVLQFLVCLTFYFLALRSLVSLTVYDWTVVIATGALTIFQFCVLYEIANELILSRSSSAGVLRVVIRWMLAVLLLVSATISALFSQPGLQRVARVFQTLDFCSNLVIIGLLLSLLLFSRLLRISWRSLPTGIALGFGVTASAEIAASSLLSLLGRPGLVTVDFVRLAAFHMCVLVWLFYIFFPPQVPVIRGSGLKKLELETWDQELGRMVR